MEELQALILEVKTLRRELEKERAIREERDRIWKGIEQRLYNNMRLMKMTFDDKVEMIVDRVHAIQEKLITVEDATMELETRLERLETGRGLLSRSLTPVNEVPAEPIMRDLPIRVEKRAAKPWNVRVVLVPRKLQQYAYEYNSTGHKRCQGRNLVQDIEFSDDDCLSFNRAINTAFKHAFRGRPWMPLRGYRVENDPFGRMGLKPLPANLCSSTQWNRSFLEEECIAHDKMLGNILYLALQAEELSWEEIRNLPMAFGSDESCWRHEEELDGTLPTDKSMESDMMYDYSEPPPYSSRTHPDMDRLQHRGLDLLASASLLPMVAQQQHPPQSSGRSIAAISDSISISAASDGRSITSTSQTSFDMMSDDEHRDKKLRLHPKPSESSLSHHFQHAPLYLSGRSKRKMPVRESKQKDPSRPAEGSGSKFKFKNSVRTLLNHPTTDHNSDRASTLS